MLNNISIVESAVLGNCDNGFVVSRQSSKNCNNYYIAIKFGQIFSEQENEHTLEMQKVLQCLILNTNAL